MTAAQTPEASVILVNVDAEVLDFYDFAQRHALDLIGGSPPVWMWTLADSGTPPGTAERVLGRWPRRFVNDDQLGEALADAVEEGLNAGGSVGVVVLARSPSRLLAGSGLDDGGPDFVSVPLLAPLAGVIARNRDYRTSFWSICAVLEGPEAVLQEASRLVATPIAARGAAFERSGATGFDTVVFLNLEYEGQVRIASEQQRASLRLVVDLARAGGETWDALKPAPQGRRPRILWLQVEPGSQLSRPLRLRRAITSAIERKLDAAVDPKEEDDDDLRGTVERFLGKYAPKAEDAGPVEQLKFDWNSAFDDGAAYAGVATASVGEAEAKIEAALREHYRTQIDEIRLHQAKRDAAYMTARDQVERLPLALADGSFGAHAKHVIARQVEAVEEHRDRWREAARRARDAVLALHRAAQARDDPEAPGEIDLDSLGLWMEFKAAEDQVRLTAKTLPPDWRSRLWIWAPILLFLLISGANVESQKTWGEQFSALARAFTLPVSPGLLGIGVAVVGFLFLLAAERKFRRLYRNAIAVARDRAREVGAAIEKALSDTQDFIANAHAALIAEELTGRLQQLIQRVASDRFMADYENTLKLVGGVEAEAVDAEEAKAAARLADVTRTVPMDRWVQEMIRAWANDFPPVARAHLALVRTGRSHAFEVDEAALRQDRLQIVSSWASEDFAVSAAPLAPVSGADVELGTVR